LILPALHARKNKGFGALQEIKDLILGKILGKHVEMKQALL